MYLQSILLSVYGKKLSIIIMSTFIATPWKKPFVDMIVETKKDWSFNPSRQCKIILKKIYELICQLLNITTLTLLPMYGVGKQKGNSLLLYKLLKDEYIWYHAVSLRDKTNDDYNNALHEVMQQIALAGLYRVGFWSVLHFMVVPAFIFS